MKADTIEELADMLGFTGQDKDNFLAEVERLQRLLRQPGGRGLRLRAYRLSAIRQPPSTVAGSAARCSPRSTVCALTRTARCSIRSLNVIEGAWGAAGDVSGSFFSGNYPVDVVGVPAAPAPLRAVSGEAALRRRSMAACEHGKAHSSISPSVSPPTTANLAPPRVRPSPPRRTFCRFWLDRPARAVQTTPRPFPVPEIRQQTGTRIAPSLQAPASYMARGFKHC